MGHGILVPFGLYRIAYENLQRNKSWCHFPACMEYRYYFVRRFFGFKRIIRKDTHRLPYNHPAVYMLHVVISL